MAALFSPIRDFFRKGDLVLLALCLLASGFGLVLIFSATQYYPSGPTRFLLIQSLAIVLGVVAYMLLTMVDFRLFVEKNWKLLLAFNVLFILLLLTPLGTDHDMGNLNWLDIPGLPVDIQPNEVVKLPFILMLSYQISRIQERDRDISSLPSLLQIGGHAVFMLGLIAAVCGDFGMCVVYLFIFAFMAWASGVKLRWFILVGGGAVLAAVILWLFVLPETSLWSDYRIMRFRVVFDHDLDPQGMGFQQECSIRAIGAGQLFGCGYLNGPRTQAAYSSALPSRYNDFIFAVCGEELGMAGCLLLLVVLCGVVICAALELFNRPIIGLFLGADGTAAAVDTGRGYLTFMGFFFCLIGFKMAVDGLLRGAGDMKRFTIANLANLGLRVAVAMALAPRFGIHMVWVAVPIGWFVNWLISYSEYRTGKWKKALAQPK